MRSALGIRRIKDVDVSQVLHASDTDIRMLRNKLQSWGVSSFRSYPVLLRALTHPSISNWAERVLNLPKRSLGPNTLELLGDRVVGTAAAFRVLQWRKAGKFDVSWHSDRPTLLVRSLVGNRGMATVAAEIGIDQLIRWEKGRPPESHRLRLTSTGVDQVTGISSNVQINALASAYEAVAAAIYLDGGLFPAESFVHNTLLRDPGSVQRANVDLSEYEENLARELERVMGTSVSFVTSRYRPGRSASIPVKSFEKVQCEILDLESTAPQNEAHRVYYAGIALRPMSEVDNDIREEDILYLSSHFSVENARIAALTGALEMLRGRRKARVITKDSNSKREKLQMRKIVFGCDGPVLEVRLRQDGAWLLDGEYRNVTRILHGVGAPGMGGLQDVHSADVREGLESLYRQESTSRYEENRESTGKRGLRYGRKDTREGGFPRRERGVGEAAVCVESVEKCVSKGIEMESSRRLTQDHEGLRRDIGTGVDISESITRTLDEVRDAGMEERSLLMKSYHAVGHNVMRLWGVQRSMTDVCEDRSMVIGECERRGSLGPRVERVMLGNDMGEIGDLRCRKVFVALGICVEQVGLGTAVAWLSGAEERLKERVV